jgi:ribosomal protein S18 acetylase RimI-like enzyme
METITLESPEDFLTYREGSGNTVEIYNIVVGSERGQGRGRKLVEMLLEELDNRRNPKGGRLAAIPMVFAITRHSNSIARQFYIAVGFNLVGYLNGFYGVNNDAMMYGMNPCE